MVVAVGALALVAGCEKTAEQSASTSGTVPSTAALVAPAEQSRHFATVQQQLELGGVLYGYMDIDGDAERLAGLLRSTVENIAQQEPKAALFQQDYAQLFADLGLTDVKAIGLSSVATGGGLYRNRTFLYTPGGRHGLLAGLGGPAAPFANLALAPADADLFCENEMDLPAVYSALRAVVARVGGEGVANMVETQLKQAGQQAGISAYDLVQRWKGRQTLVLRFEGDKSVKLPTPEPVTIPAFSLLIRFDGIAPALKGLLDGVPVFEKSEADGVALYALKVPVPVDGWSPLVAIDGDALYIVSSRAFYDTCRAPTARLSADPQFAAALANVGPEGNGLSYVSPRFFTKVRQVSELNPQFADKLALAMSNLPDTKQPLITVRANLPDGVLFRSSWNASLKQDLALVAVYNPVTIGAMAAMAVPAFNKVRATSQDKTIQNNLRQLGAAAEQYYLETGNTSATYDDLVGPDRFIRALKPVAGENYRSILFKQGYPLRLRLSDGRTIEVPAP